MLGLTPLNGTKDSGFEGFRKAGVEKSCLLLFAFERLKVVEAALPSDFALELFEIVKAHARRIRADEKCLRKTRAHRGRKEKD